MNKNVYSVGQINNYIKNMFAADFMLRHISIKGEVSNCKYHSSGHIYFSLKDGNGLINAVMFAGNRKGLTFRMKEGDQVIVTGSVEVYERSGTYQLYARQIEHDGEGNLYLKFEALKKELEEMGMFAPEYKQPIPRFVRTVGVVTAPTGAAIQDIRNISHRRNPYVQVILYPALVQGEGAAESIVNGIHALEHYGVDVMIVGRGGGSFEDLFAFNEEIVARAIFECSVPIISAVGHETDWTIADFVSDLRAPTPSAAAELAVFDHQAALEKLLAQKEHMDRILQGQINYARQLLIHDRTRLQYLSPQNQLNEKRKQICDYEIELRRLMEGQIKNNRHRLELLASGLDAVSPLKRLGGGFAYIESGEKPVKTVGELHKDQKVTIYLPDGTADAVIEEVTERKLYGKENS